MTISQRMQFDLTMDMNANYPVFCTHCGVKNKLMAAHLEGWAFKGKTGFVCVKCNEGGKDETSNSNK